MMSILWATSSGEPISGQQFQKPDGRKLRCWVNCRFAICRTDLASAFQPIPSRARMIQVAAAVIGLILIAFSIRVLRAVISEK